MDTTHMCGKCNRNTSGCDRIIFRDKDSKITSTFHKECLNPAGDDQGSVEVEETEKFPFLDAVTPMYGPENIAALQKVIEGHLEEIASTGYDGTNYQGFEEAIIATVYDPYDVWSAVTEEVESRGLS